MLRRIFYSESLVSDAVQSLLVRITGIGLLFAMTTLSARFLGPDHFGLFNATLSLAALLATLAPLGADRVVVRRLSVIDDTAERGFETAVTHQIALGLGLVIAIACLTMATLGDVLWIPAHWQTTILLGTVMFVPIMLAYLRQWIAIPLAGSRRAVVPEQMMVPVLFIIVLVAMKLLKLEFSGVTACLIYSAICLVVWAGSLQFPTMAQAYGAAWKQRATPSQLRQRMKESFPFAGIAMSNVLQQKSLPLIIAATCGFEETAQFAIAISFANLAGTPVGIANMCVIPRCTQHAQRMEHQQAGQIATVTATAVVVTSVTIGIATLIFAPYAVLLLGKSYSAFTTLLPFLVAAAIADSLPGPSMALVQSMQLEREFSRMLLRYIPLQLGVVYLGGLWSGLLGITVAYLITRCLWAIMIVTLIYRGRQIMLLPSLNLR
ncbi:MAG: oligosaccharide flippase family protein, partial [Planctomycetaceae bacterium]|nr:oligosaccharide flippase family protein [Planctomycetaceae bacterium]